VLFIYSLLTRLLIHCDIVQNLIFIADGQLIIVMYMLRLLKADTDESLTHDGHNGGRTNCSTWPITIGR